MDVMTIMISLVFISQIFVLSFYVPFVGRRYSRELVRRYPEAEYPLLYPLGADVRISRGQKLKYVYYLVGMISALALLTGLSLSLTSWQLGIIMMICLGVQDVPNVVASIWMRQRDQALSKMPPPGVRRTQLIPRHWQEFVSRRVIVIFISLYLLLLFITISCITIDWGTTETKIGVFLSAIFLLIANTLYIAIVIWQINKTVDSPRDDPYASSEDVLYRAKKKLQMLIRGYIVFALISLSAFSLGIVKYLDISYFDGQSLFIFCSILIQTGYVGFVKNMANQLNTTDYSVYREDNRSIV